MSTVIVEKKSTVVVDNNKITVLTIGTQGPSAVGFHTNPITLTDAATIAVDATLGNFFRVTLGGNRTLGNPTGATDGQMLMFEIIQDATGSRLLSLGNKFVLGSDVSSTTLTTTANARDFIGVRYNQTSDKFYVIAFVRGYV